jgi:hypothetical protein
MNSFSPSRANTRPILPPKNNMEKPVVKIYGERNTGTNYLEQLVSSNLDARLLAGVVPGRLRKLQKILPGKEYLRDIYFHLTFHKNLGWKHSLVKADVLARYRSIHNNLSVITLTKNPYSWALSLYRHPYHHKTGKISFEEFLERKWHTVRRENSPVYFENPVSMWNKKSTSYIQIRNTFNCANIKYEDLLNDPESIINMMSLKLGIHKKSDRFINITASTKDTTKDFKFYNRYYLEEQWKDDLSAEAISIINRQLDTSVLDHFGYTLLS